MRLSELRHSLNEEIKDVFFVGGIYPLRHLSILASAPGVGKTWTIIKQICNLSRAGYVFGSDCSINNGCKSLLFCGETGIDIIHQRVYQMNEDYNDDLISIYTAGDMANAKIPYSLDTPEGRQTFDNIISGEKPGIVFIDTLISFRNGDENSAQETAQTLGALQGIAQRNNCAVVISHHLRKKKKGDTTGVTMDDIIGSSALTRLCSMALIITHDEINNENTTKCVKSWWKKPNPYTWKIDYVDGHLDLVYTNNTPISTKNEILKGSILALPIGEVVDAYSLSGKCDCSVTLAKNVILMMEGQGYLRMVPMRVKGRPNQFVRMKSHLED